jgi:UDP-N-acetylglucosamine--N-acetylmuramyl-(pentapeptide) pyrophosphoryl-undecaprenol N-acetylglucosamine transferase
VIFVSVGTNEQAFDRLLVAVSRLPGGEPLVVQYGSSTLSSGRGEWRDFMSFEEVAATMSGARAVVVHAGVGSILLALRVGHRPIVMPRRAHRGEAVDDHQLHLARRLDERGVVTLAENEMALRAALAAAFGPSSRAVEQAPGGAADGLAAELRDYLATLASMRS